MGLERKRGFGVLVRFRKILLGIKFIFDFGFEQIFVGNCGGHVVLGV